MIEETEEQFLVSVVIIAYNGRAFLGDCLTSVLDQDLPREQYEVVVVDNASPDGSADYVEESFPGVRVLRLDRNYGADQAINLTLSALRGRYFAYLNQDTVTHRRWLSELVETIMAQPDTGLVESNMILPAWPEYETTARDAPVERAYVCDLTSLGVHDFSVVPVTSASAPIPVLTAYCAGCIVDPRIIERLGYFLDPGFFAYSDDVDIGLRLSAAGYRVLLAPRSVVYHDTDWHFKWDRRSLRRAYLSTRNMFLMFYKLAYFSEFLALFPRICLGKMLKAGQHCHSLFGRIFYAFAALPMLVAGLVGMAWNIPAYRERRKLTQSRRKMKRGWLVDSLVKSNWQPDEAVWAKCEGRGEVASSAAT
jgi:GT2 family glycosyltransferase